MFEEEDVSLGRGFGFAVAAFVFTTLALACEIIAVAACERNGGRRKDRTSVANASVADNLPMNPKLSTASMPGDRASMPGDRASMPGDEAKAEFKQQYFQVMIPNNAKSGETLQVNTHLKLIFCERARNHSCVL